jgi:hypothetical protein
MYVVSCRRYKMFNLESDNHGYINRATWLAALWYLDVMQTLQANHKRFTDAGDVHSFLLSELDGWAMNTFVSDADIEKIELYYMLNEIDYQELLDKIGNGEREQYND